MHYVYVAPKKDEAFATDVERLRKRGIRVHAMTPRGAALPVKRMVHFMGDSNCVGLIVPDDHRRDTPLVQQLQTCAHLMRLEILSVTTYLTETKPAAASAVPATQHPAAAGKTTMP
jgi:hypothetical protein